MHRALLFAALLIGTAIELTGCGHCDCDLPYESARAEVELQPFVMDDASPTRTFVANVIIGGPWESSDTPGDEAPALDFTARLEPILVDADGPAAIGVHVYGEDQSRASPTWGRPSSAWTRPSRSAAGHSRTSCPLRSPSSPTDADPAGRDEPRRAPCAAATPGRRAGSSAGGSA